MPLMGLGSGGVDVQREMWLTTPKRITRALGERNDARMIYVTASNVSRLEMLENRQASNILGQKNSSKLKE